MAKKKMILLRSTVSKQEREFTLNHAQTIFQEEAAKPDNPFRRTPKDLWEIVGDEYIFDPGKNELRRNPNRRLDTKPEAQVGAGSE